MVRTDQLVFVGFVVTLSSLLTGKSAFEIDTPDDGSSCAQQLSGGKFPAKILANSTTASRLESLLKKKKVRKGQPDWKAAMDPSSKTTTTTVAKKRKKFSNLSPDKNSTAIFATHLVAMSQRQNASASQDWSRNGLEAVNNSLEEIGPSLAEILRPESLLHIFSPSFNFPTNLSKHEKDSEGNQDLSVSVNPQNVLKILAQSLAQSLAKVLLTVFPVSDSTAADGDADDKFEFYEPMVFDLVRDLGSPVGATEMNYLLIAPLNGDPIEFSPEIEVTYSAQESAEFELPFSNNSLEAIKFSHLTTLTNETYFKEGFYFLGEFLTGDQDEPSADGRNPDDRNPDGRNPDNADRPRTFITPEEEQSQPPKKPDLQLIGLYVNAQRLSAKTSNILMVGIQTQGLIDKPAKRLARVGLDGLLINNSVFYELRDQFCETPFRTKNFGTIFFYGDQQYRSPYVFAIDRFRQMDPSKQWVVAIEFIFYFDLFGGGSFVAAYPQVHWIASTNFELQGSILRIRSQTFHINLKSHILDKFPPKQLTYM